MTPIPLFVEICAGTAAVSLRLHRRMSEPAAPGWRRAEQVGLFGGGQ